MTDEKNVLPANIKQVGTIGDGKRVYMEDYASTYIQQYAAAEPSREKIAVLVGQVITVEEQEVLFISGVIQGKYSTHKNGMVQLTEKSWQYINKQLNIYFEGLKVVGWAYVQPGFEDYIKDNLVSYQLTCFDKGFDVLYLIDPQEKISSFYVWDGRLAEFSALRGYMVYYEKNEGMHEYMLENKLKATEEHSFRYEETPIGMTERLVSEEAPVRRRSRKNAGDNERKRMINMLGTVSFVMLLVCFIMGAGLIENDERITRIEARISDMETAVNGVQSVFAAKVSETETHTSSIETTSETTWETTTEKHIQLPEIQEPSDTYTVSGGDTLSSISRAVYGTIDKIDDIMTLNGIDDPNRLVEGMELELP